MRSLARFDFDSRILVGGDGRCRVSSGLRLKARDDEANRTNGMGAAVKMSPGLDA